MENINIVLAGSIYRFRKAVGLTQEELATRLGVTFQAVSKWENGKAAPDISLLPEMAEIFGCYIDELFSREVEKEIHYDACMAFPWPDDNTLRGIVCKGRKILQKSDMTEPFAFEVVGDALNVITEWNLSVTGSVQNGCTAEGDVAIGGNLAGGCAGGGDIVVGGNLSGSCVSDGDLTVGGNLSGGVVAEDVCVGGEVRADRVVGNVTCSTLNCQCVEGAVTIVEKS